jgi:lipid-A-disaccharide synthase
MRVFLATGEASGDMLAAALAARIRELVPGTVFAGIGGERMAAAGVVLTARTAGWGNIGPLAALRTIPVLLVTYLRHLGWLIRSPWDLIVFVDFGAFNLRFARSLRKLGYRRPILYLLPPGAWLDLPAQAWAVAGNTTPLTAFEHQRDFYRELGLPIAYFGHPLASLIEPREPLQRPPADAGTIAILPGSRRGEIARHLPELLAACRLVRAARPRAQFVLSAADAEAHSSILRALAVAPFPGMRVVRGAQAAFEGADAALIASGTAVLEAVLREVPCIAFYVVGPATARMLRQMYSGRFWTLPNILLEREAVPELLQADASAKNLARALETLLADPAAQLPELRAVRVKLGEPDALSRCAAFAVELARS